MSKLSPANGHYREAWIRPPSTQRSGLADLNEQFTTASRLTEIKRPGGELPTAVDKYTPDGRLPPREA
jgi:uncharacterized protein YidB (DUF937 family)